MKYILVIFLILFCFDANAKKITKKCEGYCEGSIYDFNAYAGPQEGYRVKKGKLKKVPIWSIYRGLTADGTVCTPFLSWISRSIPEKVKKKDMEKYLKDFRQGTDIYQSHYEINSCMPCPPNVATKNNKSGFCPLPMFQLDVFFKDAFDLGYVEKMPYDELILGRDITGDLGINLKNSLKNIVMEQLVISTSTKEELVLYRLVPKMLDENTPNKDKIGYYLYNFATYKTAAKQQQIKRTDNQVLMDTELMEYLDEYINEIQKKFSEVLYSKGNNFKKYKELYKLIPSKDDMEIYSNSFIKVKEYHIQTRN